MNAEFQKAILMQSAFRKEVAPSERPYILSLQALGALRNVELHGLPFLKTFEPAGLDCREVHKNILAALTADEAVAFGVVEPLYCSLFCHIDTRVPFGWFTLERFGGPEARILACWARAAHDRFGLTHSLSYAPDAQLASTSRCAVCNRYDFAGFDVPRDTRSSSSAHLPIRREACSIRRAAVERKSLTSARNSSDVGLVCAIAFFMPQGIAKMKKHSH